MSLFRSRETNVFSLSIAYNTFTNLSIVSLLILIHFILKYVFLYFITQLYAMLYLVLLVTMLVTTITFLYYCTI